MPKTNPTQRFTNKNVLPAGGGRKPSLVRSWTRLAVGTVLSGYQTLAERTQAWHEKTSQADEQGPYPLVVREKSAPDENSHTGGSYPDALDTAIGLVFDAQNRINRARTTFRRMEGIADRIAAPVLRNAEKISPLRPISRRLDRMAARGQQQIDYWTDVGKIESEYSREIFKTATATTLDETLDYLSTNPDVQELVQNQSTSLVNEIVEEIRERAVSLNMVLEGWIRKALGLVPRTDLPGPTQAVRRGAILWQTQRKRAS